MVASSAAMRKSRQGTKSYAATALLLLLSSPLAPGLSLPSISVCSTRCATQQQDRAVQKDHSCCVAHPSSAKARPATVPPTITKIEASNCCANGCDKQFSPRPPSANFARACWDLSLSDSSLIKSEQTVGEGNSPWCFSSRAPPLRANNPA